MCTFHRDVRQKKTTTKHHSFHYVRSGQNPNLIKREKLLWLRNIPPPEGHAENKPLWLTDGENHHHFIAHLIHHRLFALARNDE